MTMVYEWKVHHIDYTVVTQPDDEGKGGQVKIHTLHWTVDAHDDAYSGYPPVNSYGTTDPADADQTYPLASLPKVPQKALILFVHREMGEDQVKEIEDGLKARYEEQITPTHGTVAVESEVEAPDDGGGP